jgi:hypothetical protein
MMTTRNLFLAALLIAGAAACGDSPNDEAVGNLDVIIITAGTSLDPDGYSLTLVGVGSTPVTIMDTVRYETLPIDDYELSLTGVAANCTVQNGATKGVYVTMGDSELHFDVDCS